MSDILQEADKIAGQDRSRDYGHPHPNHKRIADGLNWLWGAKLKELLTPADIAKGMIVLKLARLMNTYTRDSVLDIAGYAKCLDMINDVDAARRNGVNVPYDDTPTKTE